MKKIVILALSAMVAYGQNSVSWKATTGDVALSGAGTTATIQKPATATPNLQINIDQITVYCSVACNVTQTANGSAASATAGTVAGILPSSPSATLPVNFYTASNVGAGTDQGGIIHIPAGQTITICLSVACGRAADVYLGTKDSGQGTNYSVVISSITGTVNITFFGRVKQ